MAHCPEQHTARFTFEGRLRSIRFALRGIHTLLISQPNAWLHAVATLLVVSTGWSARIARQEWCGLVLAIIAVWAAEALNTALELLCDVASPEFHPLIEQAKDVAAGAVLITALGAVCIGLLVLGPHLLE